MKAPPFLKFQKVPTLRFLSPDFDDFEAAEIAVPACDSLDVLPLETRVCEGECETQ